jgi:hypothetical protein
LPPYLYLICRDLKHTGYQRVDILRAYALFLVLLPVVLNGVKNSILQLLFGIKAQFGRTPKVEHRTAIPLASTAAVVALFGWSVWIFHADVVRGDELHAIFALSNALALGYGLVAMIGLRAIAHDYAHAAANLAVGIWRKVFPGRTTPLPEPVMLPSGLQLIAAEHAPPLQASATQEAVVTAIQRHANKLRGGTSLGAAELPRVASAPLQPDDQTLSPEHDKSAQRSRRAS